MSKQPDTGSESASTSEPGGSFSTNGTHHDVATAVAAPDAEATAAKSTDEPVTTADADATVGSADAIEAEVAPTEAAASENAESDVAASAPSSTDADDPATFLSELVKAMQTTAGVERARIATETDRRREDHLAAIQARRETEAQTMRELAAGDLKAIDGWAEEERQRIKAERERRAAALDDDLKKSLSEHGSKIDREIEVVEAAIAGYRVEVEAFFAVLDGETDPVAIARHAGRRPSFPSLGQPVAADAPAEASAGDAPSTDAAEVADAPAAESAPVAVMDISPGANLAASFPTWNASSPDAPVEATPDPLIGAGTPGLSAEGDAAEAAEPVAVAQGASDEGSDTILHAVASGRPLGWLRRGGDSSDHQNG
jgi:hypothetical protein